MKIKNIDRSGFTLIELLVVIGVLAVIIAIAILFINPSQLAAQGRDTNRVAALTTLNQNIALYHEIDPSGSLGTSSILYISIPDPAATSTAGDQCQGLGKLPVIGSTTYHCAASSTYLNTNGTGWIPVDFSAASGTALATLPVDPINTTSSDEYYVYTASGTEYEVLGNPEAQKTIANSTSSFTQGSDIALASFPVFPIQNIWMVQYNSPQVQKWSTSSTFETGFGYYGSTNGDFKNPFGIAIDSSGNIWVADYGDTRVEEFNASGTYESQFGSSGSGNGQFEYPGPGPIAIDSSGNIWVGDYSGNRIEKFSASGTYESQFGSSGSGNGQFNHPSGIAIDSSGNIWVADSYNSRVEEFSASGTYESQFGSAGYGNGQFQYTNGIAIDSSGNIWVTDDDGARVEEFNASGTYESQFGTFGTGNSQLEYPSAIAFDEYGNIWVGSSYSASSQGVKEFTTNGTYVRSFGSTGGTHGLGAESFGIVIR